MVQTGEYTFSMPNSSWDTIQRILRAYNAARNRENPTVNEIATLAGIHRPNVSANNNFLRDLGLLQESENKLTQLGTQLATGIELGNESMKTEAIQTTVLLNADLSQLVDTLRVRGTMKVEAFKGNVITMADLPPKSPAINYIKTIIDYLEDGQLIKSDGDTVQYIGQALMAPEPRQVAPDIPQSGGGMNLQGLQAQLVPLGETAPIPLPLGVGKLAYLILPDGWQGKDLAKLVKMIQLALGEDSEITK